MDVEFLGVIASIIVLVSFLFENEKKIRTINIFGAICFIIYGIIINSFSVFFLNAALCFIHLYFLLKK